MVVEISADCSEKLDSSRGSSTDLWVFEIVGYVSLIFLCKQIECILIWSDIWNYKTLDQIFKFLSEKAFHLTPKNQASKVFEAHEDDFITIDVVSCICT